MAGIVLLSEIHPLSTQLFNPLSQAYHWHSIISPKEIQRKQLSFIGAIQIIERKCTENSKQLLIRDWSHLDFIGLPFIEKPSYRMMLVEALLKDFEILQLALVRHPIDQWLSSRNLLAFQNVTLEMFLHGYREFSKQIQDIPFIHYEDFTKEPEKEMRVICKELHLNYDEDFIINWTDYHKITGDTSDTSRGSHLNKIIPMPRFPIKNKFLSQFRNNKDYMRALELLGYQDE
jgi:hypothetical protein